MTTLAEQVAEVKVGDWVEVEVNLAGDRFFIRGRIRKGVGDSLLIGEAQVIRYNTGVISAHLTSITRVPRPIPSEPEVGSFALLGEGDIAWRLETDSAANWDSKSGNCGSWDSLYPLIVKLYTPSGELVTGFEYAGGDK